MTVVHGSYSVWFLVALIAWVLCLKCSAMDLSNMDVVLGQTVQSALVSAGITIKEAIALMDIDETQFRKALRGEGYRLLALNHLIKLPYRFWLAFGPTLMWLVAKKNAIEIAETLGVRTSA